MSINWSLILQEVIRSIITPALWCGCLGLLAVLMKFLVRQPLWQRWGGFIGQAVLLAEKKFGTPSAGNREDRLQEAIRIARQSIEVAQGYPIPDSDLSSLKNAVLQKHQELKRDTGI